MLDKSPEKVQEVDFSNILDEFGHNIPSIILYSEPFNKVEFLNKLIDSTEIPIIFVDMDLLYTGYVESGMIPKKENVAIWHPDKTTWRQEISEIISRVSEEKFLVVIDSFNGIYNMYDDLASTIFVNSCIMLLSSLGCNTNSSVIVTGLARKKGDSDKWLISPGGKQIIKSSKTGIYFLKKNEKSLILSTLGEENTKSKAYEIM